jgi:O-antigen ligase
VVFTLAYSIVRARVGLQAQWQALTAQALPPELLLWLAGIVAGMTGLCVVLSSLKHYVKIAPLEVGTTEGFQNLPEKDRPKLTIFLCPYSTMVRFLLRFPLFGFVFLNVMTFSTVLGE